MAEEWLHRSGQHVGHVPVRTFLDHSPEKCHGIANRGHVSNEDIETEALSSFDRERKYVVDRVREQWPEAMSIELSQRRYNWDLNGIAREWIERIEDQSMDLGQWTTFKIGVWTTFVFERPDAATFFRVSLPS